MTQRGQVPPGVPLSADIEYREGRPKPYKARVRWVDPATGRRRSISEAAETREDAEARIELMRDMSRAGVDLSMAVKTLAEYGEAIMPWQCEGWRRKHSTHIWLAGISAWSPDLGHLAVRMVTYGAVDRAVHGWIADGCSRSTIKNSLAILVRVLEQAVRDGIVEYNRARITGWQREYQLAEDELDDPRSLALPDWDALEQLAAALVARSDGRFPGWGEVVEFTACTAARIGETSGVRRADINRKTWIWNVRRQTTPGPGG